MTDEERLLRAGFALEYATLAWNVVGSVLILATAIGARSIALAGFGLDSVVEIGASTVVLWQLRGVGKRRERRALRVIAASFIVLAIYILVQSIRALSLGLHPDSSPLGIAWLAITFVVMVGLARGKSRVGAKLKNPVIVAEAQVTMVDAYLAAAVLIGIGLNAALGWWWADPVAGLVIVFYGLREGRHAWVEASGIPV
jgi:divalent metal cation (Fe/Co/Zn/Cd) transporter